MLLVLDADPTADIGASQQISLVVLDGEMVDRTALLSQGTVRTGGVPLPRAGSDRPGGLPQ